MNYIIPSLLILLLLFCIIKRLPAYSYFSKGAKDAIDLCISIFPFFVAIFVAIELFRISGLSTLFANTITPVLSFFGIPPELAELVIIRPFSGSSSIALLSDIYNEYGVDSYISKCASVMMSASDTIFYIAVVYFGTKTKKLSYAIPVALLSCFVGIVVSCLLCKFI